MINNGKVAIFIPSLAGGGAERFMLNLANEFSKKDKEVFFIVCSTKGEYASELDNKVSIVDLNARESFIAYPALLNFLEKRKTISNDFNYLSCKSGCDIL